jgi:hypothetical protein
MLEMWKCGNESRYRDLYCVCQMTQLSADAVDEVVRERNVSTLDNGERDRGYCDMVLPVEGK